MRTRGGGRWTADEPRDGDVRFLQRVPLFSSKPSAADQLAVFLPDQSFRNERKESKL